MSKTILMFNLTNWFLLWFENQSEGDTNNESKGGKDKPASLPFTNEEALLLTIDNEVLP